MSDTSTLARIVGTAQAFGQQQPAKAARPATPTSAAPASGPVDRVSAILGHAEAVGREKLATHIAHATSLPVGQAVAMLAASERSGAHLAAAMGGAAVAREALGLAPDAARDAAVARGVEAHLTASGLWSAPVAGQPCGTEAEDFAAGAAVARRLLGR